MALEDLTGAGKFLDDLVITNPVGATDVKGQGDDHIRGIKNVLLNTFPNLDAAVTVTTAELNLLAGLTDLLSIGDTQYTGEVRMGVFNTAPSGWVLLNDGTIGSAGSSATTRADADCQPLYELLWDNISDTYAAVSTGRGASGALDFAANKTIVLPKALGRVFGVAGAGATLTSRALGENLGEEDHTILASELPEHTHSITLRVNTFLNGIDLSGSAALYGSNGAAGATGNNTSANDGANVVQPTTFFTAIIKL